MEIKTDIEIAQACEKKKITEIAKVAGIDAENLNTCYPVMKAVNMGLSIVF